MSSIKYHSNDVEDKINELNLKKNLIFHLFFAANLMVSNWELNTIATCDRRLEPRRDPLPLVRQIDEKTITHLAVELATPPPKKRDIATNVPDVKSAPVSPSATQAITFIKAPAKHYEVLN